MTEEELMLTSILDCRRIDLYTHDIKINKHQLERLDMMKEQRADGYPLQYIIGHCDFMGIKIFVDERVLIPRPETEIMTELGINIARRFTKKQLRILDCGTGSGNMAIVLAKYLPYAVVTAIDISQEALDLAQFNASMQRVDDRIDFFCCDMIEYLKNDAQMTFDIIISNPPYIKTSQLNRLPKDVRKEPHLALDGGEDGLKFISPLIQCASKRLLPEGSLIIEIGDGQEMAIENIIKKSQLYASWDFHRDYTSTQRIAALQPRH